MKRLDTRRTQIARCVLLASLGILMGETATAEVVINEIFYHAPDDLEDLEYVELFNSGAMKVDLSGWKLSKGVKFSFPKGTVLDAGQFWRD